MNLVKCCMRKQFVCGEAPEDPCWQARARARTIVGQVALTPCYVTFTADTTDIYKEPTKQYIQARMHCLCCAAVSSCTGPLLTMLAALCLCGRRLSITTYIIRSVAWHAGCFREDACCQQQDKQLKANCRAHLVMRF